MPVPFGFSAGDIAIAIQLLSKVYKSLKDTGGAASEYREVSRFLQGLILTLQHLQKIELVCSDPSLVNAIQALSTTALQPILQFVEEIQKYNSAMETPLPSRRCMSAYRKADWVIRVSKKVDKLKAAITAEMQPIYILMESQNLKCFDFTSKQLSLLRESLDSRTTEQLAFNATIVKAIEDLHSAVQDNSASQAGRPEIQSHGFKEENEIRSDISPVAVPIHGGILYSQLALLNEIGENLVTLLFRLLSKVQQLTKYLLFRSLQLILLLRGYFVALPRGAKLLVQDDIHFEDVLGRTHTLPYQYFSTWTIFEAYLKDRFKNVTGESYVTSGSYHIINTFYDKVISKTSFDWPRSIFPGIQVAMSVVLDRKELATSCPRCRKLLNEPAAGNIKQICSACSWKRYLNSNEQADDLNMTYSKAAITPFENDKSGNVGSGSWAPWVWSSEDQKYYTFRRHAGLTIEYKWLPIGQASEYSVALALEKTEPWKNEEISLFKWIHSPLLTDFEDGLRKSKAVSEEESEGKHQKLLDSRYKRVSPGHYLDFFCRGRVFSTLWTEPANEIANRNGQAFTFSRRSSYLPTYQNGYLEIRRFVVTLNKGSFSQCVPIHTYNHSVTLRQGILVEDQGVIYTGQVGSRAPDLLPEDNGITKGALRVELDGGDLLDVTSRINYGKTYTVEHDVKVLSVGKVAPEHLALLNSNWKEAMW